VTRNNRPGDTKDSTHGVMVKVEPGVCGFTCSITAKRQGREVTLDITSECGQIQQLGSSLGQLSIKDLFMPHTKNPVFLCAENARCHLACPIPMSVIKAAEVALGLALPKDASLTFES